LLLREDDCAGEFFISGFGEFICFSKLVEDVLFSSCGQYVIAFFSEGFKDFDYLLGGFTGAIYDFREAAADLAMMVDAGEAEVFERQMPQFLNGLVDRESAVANVL